MPLMNDSREINFVYFTSFDLFIKTIAQTNPDAILIHEPDYRQVISDEHYDDIASLNVPVILVSEGKSEDVPADPWIHILPPNFTETHFLSIFQNEVLKDSIGIYSAKILDLIVQHIPRFENHHYLPIVF